jgi:hypothetical protein
MGKFEKFRCLGAAIHDRRQRVESGRSRLPTRFGDRAFFIASRLLPSPRVVTTLAASGRSLGAEISGSDLGISSTFRSMDNRPILKRHLRTANCEHFSCLDQRPVEISRELVESRCHRLICRIINSRVFFVTCISSPDPRRNQAFARSRLMGAGAFAEIQNMAHADDGAEMAVLYLDFDGVVHGGEARISIDGAVSLPMADQRLFEHAPLLEGLLQPYPDVRIILSTDWVRHLGFDRACGRLPLGLQMRVVGAIYDPKHPDAWRFDRLSRSDAIMLDVVKRKPARWLAVDDEWIGWPTAERENLVITPTDLGLGSVAAANELTRRLEQRFTPQRVRSLDRSGPATPQGA